jgi:Carboxypeptidase regulatory-like domain
LNISTKLAFLTLMALVAAAAHAQGRGRGIELRTVHGTVVDKQELPVDSAIVYLKNERTQDIKTYISSKDGQYRFSGLDPNIDYELHAEHDGLTSSSRSISSFDTRKEIVVTLKVDHKKGGQ